MSLKIELLYFSDCPSWQTTLKYLNEILNEMRFSSTVDLIEVETMDKAKEFEFTGSPTIRINKEDIFPPNHSDFALGCRLYPSPRGMQGSPTRDMLSQKIKEFLGS